MRKTALPPLLLFVLYLNTREKPDGAGLFESDSGIILLIGLIATIWLVFERVRLSRAKKLAEAS